MAMRFSAALRATRNQDIVAAAGANAKLKFYDGAFPSAAGAVPAGQQLALLTAGATLGTSAGAVLTFSAVTQTNTNHVNGTPTFMRVTTSADVFVADIQIGAGAGNMQFLGQVVNGVDVQLNASTITEGNA
jgi:hypothetical protein